MSRYQLGSDRKSGDPGQRSNVDIVLKEAGFLPEGDIAPLDANLDAVVSGYSRSDDGFNPFHIEFLLETALNSLNTCFSLRSDAQQLEIQLRNLAHEMFLIDANIGSFDDLDEKFKERIQKLEQGATLLIDDASAHAKSEIEVIKSRVLEAEIDHDALRQAYAQNKLRLEALSAYAQEEGNALNYRQRIDRVRRIFERDFESAFRRLRTASIGVDKIWANLRGKPEFQEPTRTGYLDTLFAYAQRLASFIDEQIQSETETLLNYSIRYGLRDSAIPINDDNNGLANEEGLKVIKGESSSLEFSLEHAFFNDSLLPRMRGVGAYLVPRNDMNKESEGAKLALTLNPPSQIVEGQRFTINPVSFECGFPGTVTGTAFYGAEAVHNIDPTAGQWRLDVDEVIGRAARSDAAGGAIHDIVLQFRLVAAI